MAISLLINPSASAQQRKIAVGAHFGYGSGPTIGLGGKFQYRITDHIRLEAASTGFWDKKTTDLGLAITTTTGLDLNAHVHYLFSLDNLQWSSFYLYPLVGVGHYKVTAKANALGVSVKHSESKIGLDIGGGLEQYFLNNRFSVFAELKVGLGDGLRRFTALMGIAYHF